MTNSELDIAIIFFMAALFVMAWIGILYSGDKDDK